jgi:hypothetical protein
MNTHAKPASGKKLEQLIVLRQIQRRLGPELESIVVLALVIAHIAEEILRDVLVADEVVVDKENVVSIEPSQRIELASDLPRSTSCAACGRT